MQAKKLGVYDFISYVICEGTLEKCWDFKHLNNLYLGCLLLEIFCYDNVFKLIQNVIV